MEYMYLVLESKVRVSMGVVLYHTLQVLRMLFVILVFQHDTNTRSVTGFWRQGVSVDVLEVQFLL
jgi:hypothetical protein